MNINVLYVKIYTQNDCLMRGQKPNINIDLIIMNEVGSSCVTTATK